MGALADIANAVLTQFAAAKPLRVVTRDLKDFGDRARADLLKGIFSIVSLGEDGFADYMGREADLGTVNLIIVGQIELAESAAPSAIEDAEFSMIEDLKDFCRGALAIPITGLYLKRWRQSGQLDAPYGWISAEVEAMT